MDFKDAVIAKFVFVVCIWNVTGGWDQEIFSPIVDSVVCVFVFACICSFFLYLSVFVFVV